ncbi:MAG: DNA mismatch repair protein MutS [Nanoarchaeota archaeon]
MLKKPNTSKIPEDDDLTPAMKQFKRFKEDYHDAIIFFRMGDFYETFYEDAKAVARELDITLTKRGTKAQIPLAGIPYHAVDTYLPRLVKKGYKVAICEQIEDPKLAKGVVKRDVIRVVSPGTLTDTNALDERTNNFLMAVYDKEQYGLAVVDLSTGECMVSQVESGDQLLAEIARFMPSELLVEEQFLYDAKEKDVLEYIHTTPIFINALERRYFQYATSYQTLSSQFSVTSLEQYGLEDKEEGTIAVGALLTYLQDTQKIELSNITELRTFFPQEYVMIDAATQRNLEIAQNLSDGTSKNTLLSVIDMTKTNMGARLLKQWIKRPLVAKDLIEERHDAVELLMKDSFTRNELIEILKRFYDIERLISRITLRSANARDLIALRESLKLLDPIRRQLAEVDPASLDSKAAGEDRLPEHHLFNAIRSFPDITHIIKELNQSIKDDPPQTIREGNIIKEGYNEKLDELRDIIGSGKRWIVDLEEKERQKLGFNVKVGFNKVFGYYIEVTKRNVDQVPSSYIRKQTTANAERYITEELKEKENQILTAEERIHTLEFRLFNEVVDRLHDHIHDLQTISHKIAMLDILNSLATVAHQNRYVRPAMTNQYEVSITNSRHPVIEQIEPRFIPNDVNLIFDKRMMIITGPNMAGKSTYMRQVAAIVLLAQMGSFVPADAATIGIVDKIFTRVGARDDLASGRSTFMVEMSETANILQNATSKSLILLDEIGRGTSTFDGVSIAWSVAEYINNRIKAKTLFATHYHALNKLAQEFKEIRNYNIAVKEKDEEIIFLRKIVEGGTNKSYGIQVARLAGLPNEVVLRSKEIMRKLEAADATKRSMAGKQEDDDLQMSLFDI